MKQKPAERPASSERIIRDIKALSSQRHCYVTCSGIQADRSVEHLAGVLWGELLFVGKFLVGPIDTSCGPRYCCGSYLKYLSRRQQI